MASKKYPKGRENDIVVQELKGELMIYDLVENKAFCLNETSAIVWQACDGEKTPNQISKILSDKLGSKANEDLVWFALEQLKKDNLIENSNDLSNPFLGMNRREVIKKVGFGTMIALPVVASLVAPMGVHALSCSPVNGGCTATSDCCTVSPALVCSTNTNGTPSVRHCCDSATRFIITGGTATIPNAAGNCGGGGQATRDAACDAACCQISATGTESNCNSAATSTCSCV